MEVIFWLLGIMIVIVIVILGQIYWDREIGWKPERRARDKED